MLLMFCLPDGVDRFSKRSGTPDIFEVKAMVPFANAAKGRPEGARVTDNVSTKSTYSSLDVCRTFALRHGKAGVFAASEPVEDMADIFEDAEKPGFLGTHMNLSNKDLWGNQPRNIDPSQ
jgi:hypothetical protein